METGGDEPQAVRRLSQYRPFDRGGASVREAQEDLILAVLAESGWECASISECADSLRTLFSIALDETEVARVLGTLIKAGRIERRNDGFLVSGSEKHRLETVCAESDAVRDTALSEWRAYLLELSPGLTGDELAALDDDLSDFLTHVLHRHGAEAALLLYPDDPGANRLYDALENEGLDFLRRAPRNIEEIRVPALSHFVRRPTDTQRLYLGQRLNTTYFWTVLSIDPAGAELIREVAGGQRVYLDTNLVYRLLGVQGPRFVARHVAS